VRGDYERDLSAPWQAAAVPRRALLAALPLWVAAGLLGLLLLGAFAGFSYFLNEKSDPVFARIQQLDTPATPAAVPVPVPGPPVQPRLATFLQPEIAQGKVEVRDEPGRSTVTLRGDGLFAPGSATIEPDYTEVLARIAVALRAVAGPVQVIGYTDNQPIRSTRFPSNWHLSQQRALAVMALLQAGAPAPGRYRAEGQADAHPLGDNATAAGRARNRRVEIVLTPATPS